MDQDQIKKLKEAMENPLPTPPVSYLVHWYPQGKIENDNRIAAIVTKIEGPGKLTLTMFPPSSMPVHKVGVHHTTHPAVERQAEHVRIHNGVWEYIPGTQIPKSHREVHLDELNRRKETILESERQHREAVAARESKQGTVVA